MVGTVRKSGLQIAAGRPPRGRCDPRSVESGAESTVRVGSRPLLVPQRWNEKARTPPEKIGGTWTFGRLLRRPLREAAGGTGSRPSHHWLHPIDRAESRFDRRAVSIASAIQPPPATIRSSYSPTMVGVAYSACKLLTMLVTGSEVDPGPSDLLKKIPSGPAEIRM